jgi:hypothetical protein
LHTDVVGLFSKSTGEHTLPLGLFSLSWVCIFQLLYL